MGMVKPEQLGPGLGSLAFCRTVILRPHQKPSPRPFFSRIRQRVYVTDDAVATDERAAALVGVRLGPMPPDGIRDARLELKDHQFSSHRRSERYFSPPSQKTTTITASAVR